MKRLGRGIAVSAVWRAAGRPPNLDLITTAARFAAKAEGFRAGVLSLAIVGDAEMIELHERHLGHREPTDVLTFDLGGNARAGVIDGEIVVCMDEAVRCVCGIESASERRRRSRERASQRLIQIELALYVVHGVLHLAGYHDSNPAVAHQMHAREDEILSRLGLGRPFYRTVRASTRESSMPQRASESSSVRAKAKRRA